jgi:pyrroline-5-carboxylate reductase
MIEGTILLVGCGRMGGALLEGWFKCGLNPVDVIIVEPAGRDSIAPCSKHRALTCLREAGDVPRDFVPDVVLFAVKPQVADSVVGAYRSFADQAPVFLSVIAGKTTAYFQERLGASAAIVRAMPNTPAAVGKAISALYAAPAASAMQRRVSEVLLSAVGEVAWLADESQMDAVTAVSGSGPAYVFLMVECLRDAGIAAGLPGDLAERLARATIIGSGTLLERDAAAAPDVLRHNVTSPGGTTAAALSVLMGEDGLKGLMTRAVAAAAKRSKELAG